MIFLFLCLTQSIWQSLGVKICIGVYRLQSPSRPQRSIPVNWLPMSWTVPQPLPSDSPLCIPSLAPTCLLKTWVIPNLSLCSQESWHSPRRPGPHQEKPSWFPCEMQFRPALSSSSGENCYLSCRVQSLWFTILSWDGFEKISLKTVAGIQPPHGLHD